MPHVFVVISLKFCAHLHTELRLVAWLCVDALTWHYIYILPIFLMTVFSVMYGRVFACAIANIRYFTSLFYFCYSFWLLLLLLSSLSLPSMPDLVLRHGSFNLLTLTFLVLVFCTFLWLGTARLTQKLSENDVDAIRCAQIANDLFATRRNTHTHREYMYQMK